MDSKKCLKIYGLLKSEEFHVAVHCAEVSFLFLPEVNVISNF